MPELPEVEIMRRYFETAALNKSIHSVSFYDDLDKVYHSPRQELSDHLSGNQFIATERMGKYLFAQLARGSWLHLHFGMTGDLELFQGDELPKYTRLTWNFDNGERLAFRDLRKFGVIQLIDDPASFAKAQKIGPDLLEVDSSAFAQGLTDRKVAIKTALLDQKHFAGIGNWIADEMLFDCGIHPESKCKDLTVDDFKDLLKSGRRIVKEAIAADTHYGDFPDHFFVNYRKKDALHPEHPASPVENIKVGGRGTFFVPEKQAKR